VDAVVIQAATKAVPAFEIDNAGFITWAQLIESHGLEMITILICNTRRTGGRSQLAAGEHPHVARILRIQP